MRPLIYHVAASVDGFIGHEDGSFEGFSHDEEVVQDFIGSFADYDTVLMGRKTYDVGRREGVTSPYPMMRQIVFSTTLHEPPDENVELVREGATDFVAALKQAEGSAIWLCGGGQLAGDLLRAGLIDRLILKLNPLVIGSGIPLFAGEASRHSLEHRSTKEYACGVRLLEYAVQDPG